MILPKAEVQRIASGRQTLLMTPIVRDQLTGRPKPPWAQRYRVGAELAIQTSATETEACRVLVVEKNAITLSQVDYAMARQLGHRTTADMARDWLDRHDRNYPPLAEAICETCSGWGVLEDDEPCDDADCDYGVVMEPRPVGDDEAVAWLQGRHGHREMWAVRFALTSDGLRFLSSAVIAGKQGDYVSSGARGLPGEPPAVDEITQRRLTREAHEADHDRAQARLERRITEACTALGVDGTSPRVRARVRSLVLSVTRRTAEERLNGRAA